MTARPLKKDQDTPRSPSWTLSSRIGLAVLIGVVAVIMNMIQPAGGCV